MATGSRPAFWKRAIGWTVGAAVQSVLWGLGLAGLVTGLVMWRNWHALAARGTGATAVVEHCEWERSGRTKGLGSGGTGYHSCTYTYRTRPDGPLHQGYFQSAQGFADGQAIPIRFLADEPQVSATAHDLDHPSVAPGAFVVLGGGWLGWLTWQARKRRV
jgi:hypothetical protein